MTSYIEKGNWVRVVEADMVPPGTSHLFAYQGEDIAIFNTDGEFYAIGDTCTHAEASLTDGDFYEDMRGWVAECPLHGSQFDVTTGQAVSLPATGNSGKYDLKVEDGIIYINPEPATPRRE
jgi:3-phenylpropionate/trans-cinnamate dioxygenase ferredoxin subunit